MIKLIPVSKKYPIFFTLGPIDGYMPLEVVKYVGKNRVGRKPYFNGKIVGCSDEKLGTWAGLDWIGSPNERSNWIAYNLPFKGDDTVYEISECYAMYTGKIVYENGVGRPKSVILDIKGKPLNWHWNAKNIVYRVEERNFELLKEILITHEAESLHKDGDAIIAKFEHLLPDNITSILDPKIGEKLVLIKELTKNLDIPKEEFPSLFDDKMFDRVVNFYEKEKSGWKDISLITPKFFFNSEHIDHSFFEFVCKNFEHVKLNRKCLVKKELKFADILKTKGFFDMIEENNKGIRDLIKNIISIPEADGILLSSDF